MTTQTIISKQTNKQTKCKYNNKSYAWQLQESKFVCWAGAHLQMARLTLTIKLDNTWGSFQEALREPPRSVSDCALAPSARMTLLKGCKIAMKHKVGSDAKRRAWQTETEQTQCPPTGYTTNNMFRPLTNPTRIHMLWAQWRNHAAVLLLALPHKL